MDSFQVYKDIQARTKGEIYIGVVGPVRTGKSTFVRHFMEIVGLLNMDEEAKREVRDQLPLSGSGKLITTVEPKFIPKEGALIQLEEDINAKIRLIDCVGFMVKDASGNMVEGKERMVKTPWFSYEIPFHKAAETGTQKVIKEHSSIGLVVTCDGSFGELPRANFIDSEEKTISELKKYGKPFLIILNTQKPHSEEALKLANELKQKYQVMVMPVNCEQLRKDDILHILGNLLYEFPVVQLEFYIPKWVEMLSIDHYLKKSLLESIQNSMKKLKFIRDIDKNSIQLECPYVKNISLENLDLALGKVQIRVEIKEEYYYKFLSEMTGIEIENEFQMIETIKEMAAMRQEYVKVQEAVSQVRGKGYGVVTPEKDEIKLEDPVVIKQGNKYGVKIKALSPSIHMIRANIETEIAPIVGNEEQANDLIEYIKSGPARQENIWETNIFGKSIEQLVEDGIYTKLIQISEESQQKLQDTMQKIVNDSRGGMVCIII